VCAADCATTALAARALQLCVTCCEFADAILFCDTPPTAEGFRCVRIASLMSRSDYSTFILKELPRFISTDYALVVQWDGYVVEPRAWTEEFLRCDYIGARWHWHKDGMTVGNGGFSLRSRRLLEATAAADFTILPGINEDEQICRAQRARLSNAGIRFAPEPLADRFSYERSLPARPTFGFHGLFNLWRHVEDRELIAISQQFPAQVIRSVEFIDLLIQQLDMRKFPLVEALYGLWQRTCSASEIRAQLLSAAHNPGYVEQLLQWLDSLDDSGSGAGRAPARQR
jgi:hypothetical protein